VLLAIVAVGQCLGQSSLVVIVVFFLVNALLNVVGTVLSHPMGAIWTLGRYQIFQASVRESPVCNDGDLFHPRTHAFSSMGNAHVGKS